MTPAVTVPGPTTPADQGDAAPIIACSRIVKRFGDFEALSDVSIDIQPRDIVGIVGPSGSGKSTFLRVLNGLEPFEQGALSVDGVALPGSLRDVETVRRSVGFVFQSFNLFPHLTIRRNITLAPITALKIPRLEAEDRARQLLERVGIADQIDKYPQQLSGGQQQRVAIVRALAMDPKVMLLDEPTSALDPEMIKEVLQVIRELAHSGMTMLIVTHEMGFAREIANRMLFFNEGALLVDATPENFFDRPADDRLASFLSKIIPRSAWLLPASSTTPGANQRRS